MTETLKNELDKLSSLNPITKGDSIFFKKVGQTVTTTSQQYRVIFADYIVKPFEGFDFHTKFNNDIAPPTTIMVGTIEQSTDKMYKFKLSTLDGLKTWEGWCPKKSCRLELYCG